MLSVNCIATGAINNTVVTLSKKAETTAVIVHKAPIKGHVFPLVILKAQKPMKLNAPVSDKMLTIIIILKSNTKKSNTNTSRNNFRRAFCTFAIVGIHPWYLFWFYPSDYVRSISAHRK